MASCLPDCHLGQLRHSHAGWGWNDLLEGWCLLYLHLAMVVAAMTVVAAVVMTVTVVVMTVAAGIAPMRRMPEE